LRRDESGEEGEGVRSDPACITVHSDDSSRSVTEKAVEYTEPPNPGQGVGGSQVPTTSDDALRLAVKLAVDAGEFDRAAAVLDVLRRGPVS
jgi:hypothetical protein